MSVTPSQPSALTSIPNHIHCPQCAYDLTASTSPKCSECGYDLVGFRQQESAIPWSHRKIQGYLRTYIKTVWLVLFKHKKFCEEIVRPVSYSDARKFQIVTILLVMFPTLATVYAAYWWYPCQVLEFPSENMAIFWTAPIFPIHSELVYAEIWPVALFLLCYFLFLLATTGMPSYFFHPHELPVRRQNSAIAMSYYSVAPLALIIVLYIGDLLIFHYLWPGDWGKAHILKLPMYLRQYFEFPVLVWLELLLVIICGVIYFSWPINLHQRFLPHAHKTRTKLAITLLISWPMLVILFLVCIPIIYFYFVIIINSLK